MLAGFKRKIVCYRDRNCINADTKTEYVSKIIEETEKRGIEVQLFTNWGIYNSQRIISQYKNDMEQINSRENIISGCFAVTAMMSRNLPLMSLQTY